jgi:hypothetical protein
MNLSKRLYFMPTKILMLLPSLNIIPSFIKILNLFACSINSLFGIHEEKSLYNEINDMTMTMNTAVLWLPCNVFLFL